MAGTHRELSNLRRIPLVARLLEAASAGGQPLYLTGGYLRDRLLGVRPKDELDLTVEDPVLLLKTLSLAEGESSFLMDAERDTYRIVAPPRSALRSLDITRLRAGTIEGDLLLRDFTVNAMALDLSARGGAVLDPTGGRRDIRRRTLRACTPLAMKDDPLRTLRGVRLAAALGFALEGSTRSLIVKARGGIAGVSPERIRDELFRILDGPAAEGGMRRLLRLRLLAFLDSAFRPGRAISLTLLRRCGALLGQLPPRSATRRVLAAEVQSGVSRRSLLLLAAFLRERGRASGAARLCERLVLGRRARGTLLTALGEGLPPGWDGHTSPPGREELLETFHRCDAAIEEVTILGALRLEPAAARDEVVRSFLRRYRKMRPVFLRPSLLTGKEAMEHFSLTPGPELGELLHRARRAQDLGAFRDVEGALSWARREAPEGGAKKGPGGAEGRRLQEKGEGPVSLRNR